MLDRVDLVLTDPPYGIGNWSASGGNSLTAGEAADIASWDVAPTPEVLAACVAAGRYAIVWGGNYLCGALGAFRAPLVWDKGQRGMHFADGEMAWTNFDFGTLRIFTQSLGQGDVRGARLHPTQKPVALMRWCIAQAPPDCAVILDPFMGSGTTLVASQSLGRRAIGIDISESYCRTAVERLRQMPLPLIVPVPVRRLAQEVLPLD